MGLTSKDKRDIYYRKAKEMGYRSRSAFKLEQIDLKCNIFSDANNIVDLCAAPGGWSQYIAKRMTDLNRAQQARIIAIDLQRMAPIEGVHTLKADITEQETLDYIREYFDGQQADVVVSDGAPDVTGMHDLDEYIQAQLVLYALNVARSVLRPKGTFVAKVFRQKDTNKLYAKLQVYFPEVFVVKPRCSRNNSVEAFVVCRGFVQEKNSVPYQRISEELMNGEDEALMETKGIDVPFIEAGDVSGLDSTMSYDLDFNFQDLSLSSDESRRPQGQQDKYESLRPLVSPIEPPYAEAIRRQKRLNGQIDDDISKK